MRDLLVCVYVCVPGYRQEEVRLEEMDELGAEPWLSCDTYITFNCINFRSNVTKYQT